MPDIPADCRPRPYTVGFSRLELAQILVARFGWRESGYAEAFIDCAEPMNREQLADVLAVFNERDRLKAKAAELRAIVDKLPSEEEIALAVKHVGNSVATHVSWLEYRERGGDTEPECGDVEHHKRCLSEYAQVLHTLVAARQAVELAKLIGEDDG